MLVVSVASVSIFIFPCNVVHKVSKDACQSIAAEVSKMKYCFIQELELLSSTQWLEWYKTEITANTLYVEFEQSKSGFIIAFSDFPCSNNIHC